MTPEIDQLAQTLEAAPDHWETRRQLAEHWVAAGRLEEAARLIAETPSLPDTEDDLIFAARLIGSSNPDEAHRLLDAALAANPQCAEALRAKADLFQAGSEKEAEAEDIPEATLITEADLEAAPAIPKPMAPPPDAAAAMSAPSGPAIPPPDSASPPPPATAAPAGAIPPPDAGTAPAGVPETDFDSAPVMVVEQVVETVDDSGRHILTANEIAAMEAEEEAIARKMELKNKLSSVMISVLVHALVFFILGLVIIAVPRRNPPQLVAMIEGPASLSDIPKPQVRPTPTVRQPTPSAKVVKLLTATNFSSLAVPAIDEPPPDLLVPGLSADEGLSFAIQFDTGADGWIGSLPVDMQSRCSLVDRMSRLKVGGGSKKCEDAVNRALIWLSEQQKEDGSWGKGAYPAAMTGLGLLAFLGHCETPDSAQFAEVVVGAATYLMDNAMKNEGKIASDVRANQFAYEHAIGTYALCELYTLSRRGKRKIPGLGDLLKQAVSVLINGQHPRGSWNYGYKAERSDVSVCGWQIQALGAARHTGLEFPGLEECFEKGVDFLATQQGPKGGFGYDEPGDRISLAGVGVLAMQFAGRGDGPVAKKGLDYILDTRKSLSYRNINHYEWYYTTQACFQEGDRTWDEWNEMFLEPLLDAQERDGSWPARNNDPSDRQTKGDGEVYRTCLATLMLEVYYRYLPTTEKIKK